VPRPNEQDGAMLSELKDRVAVVTGAAGGIGAAMCRRFANEGMTVVAVDIDGNGARATAAECGGRSVQVDVADPASVVALADECFEELGHVDLLCNNAGVFQGGLTWERSRGDWEWSLGVNLMGVVHAISSFVPRMIAQDTDGHIVNTSSVAALVSGPISAPYIVSKSAVFTLTECLAHDLAFVHAKIGASVLIPSAIDTGIAQSGRVRGAQYGVDETESGRVVLDFLAATTQTGLSPDAVVDPVLDAIHTGTFLIPTKPSYADQLQNRFDRLVERRLPGDVTVD
jgi:NAD(P)-dependent dehydrogenase (short-subunit alcohol dehydrogenase family)